VANNLEALKSAFEAAGISLPPGGAVAGPLLRVQAKTRVAQDRVTAIRWITETDLAHWADRRDGQDTFPELVRRLVLAEVGYHPQLRFPSGDSVAMQGWDGETKIDVRSPIIPIGLVGWELGTDKQPKTKADQAYADRTKNPQHSDPRQTTFVFATPRRWAKKAEWQKVRNAEGTWKEVRALDAVDLVQWLERFPAVALWFARLIKKLPPDVRTLDDVWREWSLSTLPPLSVPLVLADRDNTATRLWEWLGGEASVFAVQADAPIEAIAFLYAAIEQYPIGYRDFFHSRAIVAANADAARALADVDAPLIIILEDAEPGLSNLLAQKGHHVFVAIGGSDGENSNTLRRPIRYTIQEELMQMGLPREEASNLAHDSARSLTVLRRLVPSAPGYKTPGWAESDNARIMLPALLAGAWDESKPADRRVLESLSGLVYADIARELTKLLDQPDSPLRKIDAAWKIASPRDAWFRLAGRLTADDLDKFTGLVADVLGSADPRFKLEPDERWRADLSGNDAAYSGLIRTGMAEVLVLMSVFASRALSVANAGLRPGTVVKRLLGNADAERWWSLHRQLRVLAEASPDGFLTAVEDSLTKNDPPIMKLFAKGGDDFFGGGSEYTYLLWALETLAWSPDFLARVTTVLAKLAQLDPGGRSSNRPANSFQQIYRLWYPQTSATLDERNVVLNRLRKTEPETSWEFLLNLYPKGHDSAHDSPVPRWRDFSAGVPEPATHAVIIRGAQTIGSWLLEDVGTDANRWKDLIKKLQNVAPDLRNRATEQLMRTAPEITNDDDRALIQGALRHLLNHHRQFSDSGWALSVTELQALEDIYNVLEPADRIQKIRWLFDDQRAAILHPDGHDWMKNNVAADKARTEAISELLQTSGLEGVLNLSRTARFPALVGRAYAEIENASDFPTILVEALKADGGDFAHGAIWKYLESRGEPWADTLLNRAMEEKWGDEAVERLLLTLPKTEHFMRRAAAIGGEIEAAYWSKTSTFGINVPSSSVVWVIERLLVANRAREATHFAGENVQSVPSEMLIRVLSAAVRGKPNGDGNENSMFQHYVTIIFEKLDQDSSVREEDVAKLEWIYLKLLEHSNRTAKTLPKILATSPEFFVEVLSTAYKAHKEEKGLDPSAEDYEARASMATQAWTLLHTWKHVPGSHNGKIDGAELEKWVRAARILCEKADRAVIGDQQIGQVLAHSPADEDGIWPCLPVRELIEITRSADMETGIQTGIVNSRGITTRSPTDGGEQERDLAQRYRNWSGRTRLEYPRTSAMLAKIAENYDWDAKYHDNDAERQQW